MIKVYYDGKCGLCSKEINYYKSIAPHNKFKWLDIASNPKPLKSIKTTQEQALKLLHVQDHNGKVHIGVAAFCVIWRELPYWKWLAPIVSFPLVLSPLSGVYKLFANWRFKHLSHCQVSLSQQQDIVLKKYKAKGTEIPLNFIPWMRSNHAGETGAIWIYKGAKMAFWSTKIQKIASEHLHTEQQHLTVMSYLTPKKEQSIFLPLWCLMGFCLGFIPSLFGYRAFLVTIHAVESFVELHYKEQIQLLKSMESSADQNLSKVLNKCYSEEIEHKKKQAKLPFRLNPNSLQKHGSLLLA